MKLRKRIPFFFALFLLAGCMYPNELRQQASDLPMHIAQVQSAVEMYEQQQKILPFIYKEEERKLTTKYLVDFQSLGGYGANIPPTAFENGGYYLYVLTDLEKKPLVRAYDLRVGDEITRLEMAIRAKKAKDGKLPIKGKGEHYHEIDFDALRMDPLTIPSPFHIQQELPVVMDDQGLVYVDYRTDVVQYLQEGKEKPEKGEDLRHWLSRQGLFVPAYAAPMVMEENKEPKLVPYRQP